MVRGGVRNSLPGGLSPPNPSVNPDTKPCFTYFRKFSEWAQRPCRWAETAPGAATNRGVKRYISSKYRESEQFFWWGFSSSTTTMNILKSDEFLGKSGTRTIFHIECVNGKDIRRHSYYEKEDKILLLPATYLEVVSNFEMASNLHAIQLKEIKPEFLYLEPLV